MFGPDAPEPDDADPKRLGHTRSINATVRRLQAPGGRANFLSPRLSHCHSIGYSAGVIDRRTTAALVAEIRSRITTSDKTARPVLKIIEHAMRHVRGLPFAADFANQQSIVGAIANLPGAQELLLRDDALALIYQSCNQPALAEAFRDSARRKRRFTDDEIPAVTQLFTPRWVVEFLLHNTLGRMWLDAHPDSGLREQWDFLIGPEPGRARPRSTMMAADLRVLDPACGTMNFGLVAIDMLAGMYCEELDRAGRPGWPASPSIRDAADAAMTAATHNVFGMDIDPLAVEAARATLAIKLRCDVGGTPLHMQVGDGLFEAAFGGPEAFDVVVTNPPYMSSRRIAGPRLARLKQAYRSSWRDECTCFLDRSLRWVRPGGRVGMLLMQSFMFTGGFQRLRRDILQAADIESIAHFGPGLFVSGNPGTLQTVGIALRRADLSSARSSGAAVAIRLTDDIDKESALRRAIVAPDDRRVYQVDAGSMNELPRGAWAYWAAAPLRRLFKSHRRLGDIAPPRQGLATTDNARFVRCWWEVHWRGQAWAPARWFPYAKAGRFRRWHESPRHRVDWEFDGQRIKESIVQRYPYLKGRWEWVAKNSSYYGRGGVTYSYLTGGRFSARVLPVGCLFDVAGSGIFPDDVLTMLAILNSQLVRELLEVINPTINHQAGDLSELPMPPKSNDDVRADVARAIELQKQLDEFDETCPEFVRPMDYQDAAAWHRAMAGELRSVECRIEQAVRGLYALDGPAPAMPESLPALEEVEVARRWISFAIGQLIGRWVAPTGTIEHPSRTSLVFPDDVTVVRRQLIDGAGEVSAARIEQCVGGLENWLLGDFAVWHSQLYKSRPPYWILAGAGKTGLIFFADATREALQELFTRLALSAPVPSVGPVDDGIARNLCRLSDHLRDASLRRRLKIMAADRTSCPGRD
jgi:hypothetical protein